MLTKPTWEERGLINHTTYNLSLREVREGTEGRDMVSETEAKAMEEYFLVACSHCLAPLAFLDNAEHFTGVASHP